MGNRNAIGAKCMVHSNGGVQYQEKFPVRGFQSSTEIPLLFGLGDAARIDSVVVIWPDNGFVTIKNPAPGKTLTVNTRKTYPGSIMKN